VISQCLVKTTRDSPFKVPYLIRGSDRESARPFPYPVKKQLALALASGFPAAVYAPDLLFGVVEPGHPPDRVLLAREICRKIVKPDGLDEGLDGLLASVTLTTLGGRDTVPIRLSPLLQMMSLPLPEKTEFVNSMSPDGEIRPRTKLSSHCKTSIPGNIHQPRTTVNGVRHKLLTSQAGASSELVLRSLARGRGAVANQSENDRGEKWIRIADVAGRATNICWQSRSARIGPSSCVGTFALLWYVYMVLLV